ncbi:MAG TPA: nucleotidyltransferase family protein [Candidatus Sulfotelmatobacter sp.]|nr:nucleotidyltransferase family protein [Candidatus Sulfotelmatobacter sp.]
MPFQPTRAMVLAAGLGIRLRPLTLDRPKALVQVAGRSLVDHTLDRLAAFGIATAVVNLHYKGNSLRQHLATRKQPKIMLSDETAELLDTGGGVAKALPLLGADPFYVLNCDIVWRDARENSLLRLAERWDDAAMDALLLLQPTVSAIGYRGVGDFNMDPDGWLTRRAEGMVAPFVFTGVQILHPRLFRGCPAGAFSLNRLYDRAVEAGRLYGLRHEGDWMDVGTPAGLQAAEAALAPVRR